MGRAGMLVVLLLSACTKHNPEACCTTTADCAAKGLPDGTGCEDGYTCTNNTCVPPVSCQAPSDCPEELPLCNMETSMCATCLTDTDCAAGICDTGAGSCRSCTDDSECASGYCDLPSGNCGLNVTAWKYVPDACDTPGTDDWMVDSTSASFDTSTDGNCHEIRAQIDGPELCILHYRNVIAIPGSNLRATGKRALVVVVEQDFDWSGMLDISANPSMPFDTGPAGGWSVSGTHAFVAAQDPVDPAESDGGGGAGGRTAGGSGGGYRMDVPPPGNGGTVLDVLTLGPLIAGARAASVPDPPTNMTQARGGNGGGAFVVISCGGKITFSGTVNASGAGGSGKRFVTRPVGEGPSYATGGSGGGAGGNLLFEGDDISITGSFLANGGAGGDGGSGTGHTPTFQIPCATGVMANGGGKGGDGGCADTPPTDGGPASIGLGTTAGGGGGSVGWFRTATRGSTPTVTPAFAQPAFSPNEMIGRR